MPPEVIAVGMNPLPFSQVKAQSGQSAAYVTEFDNRANAGITENIVLKTSQYGTNIQTDTKLAMWITFWERNANGSYNMNIPKVTHQVIYSAADILNGKATSNN